MGRVGGGSGEGKGITGDQSPGTVRDGDTTPGSPLDGPIACASGPLGLDAFAAGGAGSCLDRKCLFRRTRAVDVLGACPSTRSSAPLKLSRCCCQLLSSSNKGATSGLTTGGCGESTMIRRLANALDGCAESELSRGSNSCCDDGWPAETLCCWCSEPKESDADSSTSVLPGSGLRVVDLGDAVLSARCSAA